MDDNRPRPEAIRRRLILAAPLLLAGSASAQTPPKKVSPAEAQYQDKPHDGLTCEACTFFRKPHACQVVEGEISPDGWCRLFDMPD